MDFGWLSAFNAAIQIAYFVNKRHGASRAFFCKLSSVPDRHYTHEQLDSHLEALERWIRDLKIPSPKIDRFHQLRKVAQRACAALKEEHATGEPAYLKSVGNYVFGLTEALEFCTVFEAFNDSPSEEIRPKLLSALSGPISITSETPSNTRPRNTMFELVLAADWKLNGLDVSLGDPDIILRIEGHTFNVECKRVYGEASLYDNLRSARNQLRKKTNISPRTHGLIAVSISRLVNPGGKLFHCPSMDDKSQLGDRMETVLQQQRREIARLGPDPASCGILFQASTPVDVGPGDHFALMGFYIFQASIDFGATVLHRRMAPSYTAG